MVNTTLIAVQNEYTFLLSQFIISNFERYNHFDCLVPHRKETAQLDICSTIIGAQGLEFYSALYLPLADDKMSQYSNFLLCVSSTLSH